MIIALMKLIFVLWLGATVLACCATCLA